jgi:hypothetical protein
MRRRTLAEDRMRRLLLLSLAALAGCHGSSPDSAKVNKKAEALVRKSAKDQKIKFQDVMAVGDSATGTTCGYFTRGNVLGGTDLVRFMVFADGNDGANPYIDQPSAPYPYVKADFEPAWKKQCIKAGYKDPHASDDTAPKKTKKKT